jgi:hypothetical protein
MHRMNIRLKYSVLFLLVAFNFKAQFFQGVGLFGGLTLSKQKYSIKNIEPNILRNSLNRFRYSGGFVAEFVDHDLFRWQMNLAYVQKGMKDYSQTGNAAYNNYDHISFENYLKIRYELYKFIPYILVGPRVEYNIIKSTTVFKPYSDNINPLQVSLGLGAGIELVTFGRLKPFIEAYYNPYVLPMYNKDNVTITGRTFELRIGIIYRPKRKAFDDCNAPRYNGPRY